MTISPKTESYLDTIEEFTKKKFRYRTEIGFFIELAEERNMGQVFDDITFFAKFISHAYAIIKRVASSDVDAEKLSIEFNDKLEKVSTLLRTLMKESSSDLKPHCMVSFFSMSHESLNNLLALLYELSWIKNYTLDQGRSS